MRGYGLLILIIVVSVLIGMVVLSLSIVLSKRELSREKLLGFECGFDVFESSRGKIDVKFYTVGLLFIIFDVEVIYFYPWSVVIENVGFSRNLGMVDFMVELIIGLVYLYRNGVVLFRR